MRRKSLRNYEYERRRKEEKVHRNMKGATCIS